MLASGVAHASLLRRDSRQVRALKSFARDKGVIVVFISQIDRSYDPTVKPCPDLDDVRLPNPLDLSCSTRRAF